MGFVAIGFKTLIAGAATGTEAVGRRHDFGIEERRAHVEERGGEKDALAGLVLGADFGLAGEEWTRNWLPLSTQQGACGPSESSTP